MRLNVVTEALLFSTFCKNSNLFQVKNEVKVKSQQAKNFSKLAIKALG